MLLGLVIGPMVMAVPCFIVGKKNKTARDFIAILTTIVEVILLLYLGMRSLGGEVVKTEVTNICAMGLYFELDGFRLLYGMIAAFMWAMTTMISPEYMEKHHNRNRYYFFMLMTLGATVGVFLSADLFTTYVCFEIMSLTSYVWVAQEETKEALRAAQTYLAVAVIGGMVMLMGLFLLYNEIGTLQMSLILERCQALEDKTVLYIAGACMLTGFGAKAGMFPLHIWLPKAHPVAPAPASALLSGILTKTGIFGVLVISCNVFLHDAAWGNVILTLGVITMFTGAFLAVFSINLKRTLACSSMSQIGFILVGIGMQGLLGHENALAVRGLVLHMVNHSMIKLVLFMAAGVVYFNLHKLDLNSIRGFGRRKPLFSFAFLTGALSISGVPLFSGYVSKTLLHESIVEYIELIEGSPVCMNYRAVEWIFLITGGMTFAYMCKLSVAILFEKNENEDVFAHVKKPYMNKISTVALMIPTILLFLMGVVPYVLMNPLADISTPFLHGAYPEHAVHYFSFANLKGAAISLTIGALIYFGIIRLCLMKKTEQGTKRYVDIWPEWMDLENLVYRPLIAGFIPNVMAFFLRIFDKLLDGFIYFMRKYVLCEVKPKKAAEYGNTFTMVLGSVMEMIAGLLNKTVRKKHPVVRNYQRLLPGYFLEIRQTSRLFSKSVSFGLMMFCIGLYVTLVYLLLALV